MEPIIFSALFNMIILLVVFLTKKNDFLIYDITPEEQWAENLNKIDENIKAIENLDVFNYKLGSGHLYE